MKYYSIIFLILRVLIVLHLILVLLKKNIVDRDIFVLADTCNKTGIGIFMIMFLHYVSIPEATSWDISILQSAALIIMLDINYIDTVTALRKYFPSIPKDIPLLDTIQRIQHP